LARERVEEASIMDAMAVSVAKLEKELRKMTPG
jgi:hypothetical protein